MILVISPIWEVEMSVVDNSTLSQMIIGNHVRVKNGLEKSVLRLVGFSWYS